MPILPENKALYPGGGIHSPEWMAIRSAIGERSGNCCEGSPTYPECRVPNGKPHPVTGSIVVLTVAHLNHDPTESDLEVLKHWCQRCHNTYDAAHRRETRRRRKAVGDLFEGASS